MDKSHLFAEIRRLAQEGNGKPPGSRLFYRVTHTRESDWKNKDWNTWNNWGDVLEEAGFPRLEAVAKFDPSLILEQLAKLTRKLQRFPVTADMRREKRSNSSFPNEKVFSDTFGSRERALATLNEFCLDNTEYGDILPLLTDVTVSAGFKKSRDASEEDETEATSRKSVVGYVYLFKSDRQYKIGSSRAPYRRVSELVNQSAFGGKLVHMIATDDPEGIERYWHKRFEPSRIIGTAKANGEWFTLSATEVAAFKRRKTM